MSEVISFRLNKENPREARALRVMKRWKKEGHNTRHIVTKALLILEDFDNNELKSLMLVELNEKLSLVSQILEQIGFDGTTDVIASSTSSLNTMLSDSFINSIREAAKPGIKLEE